MVKSVTWIHFIIVWAYNIWGHFIRQCRLPSELAINTVTSIVLYISAKQRANWRIQDKEVMESKANQTAGERCSVDLTSGDRPRNQLNESSFDTIQTRQRVRMRRLNRSRDVSCVKIRWNHCLNLATRSVTASNQWVSPDRVKEMESHSRKRELTHRPKSSGKGFRDWPPLSAYYPGRNGVSWWRWVF